MLFAENRNIDVTINAVFRDRGPAVSENIIDRNPYHLLYVITTDKTKSEKRVQNASLQNQSISNSLTTSSPVGTSRPLKFTMNVVILG